MSVRGKGKRYWSGCNAEIWDLMVGDLLIVTVKRGKVHNNWRGSTKWDIRGTKNYMDVGSLGEWLQKGWWKVEVTLGSVGGIVGLTVWCHVLESIWDVERGNKRKAAISQEDIHLTFRLSGMKTGRGKTAPLLRELQGKHRPPGGTGFHLQQVHEPNIQRRDGG